MPTTKSAIEVQISARVAVPRNGRRIPQTIIREAITHKANTGADVPGIDLRIIRWRHPPASWRDASNSEEEWQRFGRWLPSASISVVTVQQVRSR